MYHRVNVLDPGSSLTVSPENFSAQIEWLTRRNYRFLSLDGVLRNRMKASWADACVALSFDDGFRDNFEPLSLLIEASRPAALFVVVDWVGSKDFLTWKEIRELSSHGITIGSHSLTHRWLPRIENDRELEREVRESKEKIEQAIGSEVRHFSYPVGGVDDRVAGFVEKAGYEAGWVAGAKLRPPLRRASTPFALPRIKVGPSDANLFRFSFKANGMKGLWKELTS